MKVVKAGDMGLCSGVRNAIRLAEQVAAGNKGRRMCVYGNLAHNKIVMEHIAGLGMETIFNASDCRPGDVVLIRAHGISDRERSGFEEKGVHIVDATCPLVLRNQKDMRESSLPVILAGIKGHSETIAVEGVAKGPYIIVESPEDLDGIDPGVCYKLIVQTTFETSALEAIVARLDELGIRYVRGNSICRASELRREAIRRLCLDVDFIVVVGDRMSANSNALVAEARRYGKDAILVENPLDLDENMLKGFKTVGLSAGSSTSDAVIEEVERRLLQL